MNRSGRKRQRIRPTHRPARNPRPLTFRIDEISVPILDSAPDSVLVVDSEGRFLFVNQETETMFGYSRKELLGQPVEILVPERLREKHAHHFSSYFTDPKLRPMGAGLKLLGRRKDGSEFPIEISLSPMNTGRGPVVTAILRDVTEREKSEAAIRKLNRELEHRVMERTRQLQDEKDLLQSYLDVTGVIMVVIGSDQKVVLINKKGCEVLGYDEKEIVGQNWFDRFIPERLRPNVRAVFSKVVSGELEPVEHYQNPVLTRSGEERTIAWHNAVLKNEAGEIVATLSSGEDITDKLILEDQIRQAQKLAAVGRFTSGLAHEIGTPLSVIAGRAEYMLRKMPVADPLRENLERILHQIERITKIVKQLLTLTRIQPLEVRPLRLGPVIQGVLSLFDHQLGEKGVSIDLSIPETLPEIKADSDQIQQVLFNLILNAVQAMPKGGKLSIGVRPTIPRQGRKDPLRDGYVRVDVADTGSGIAPENLPRIFDPFFTTKKAGEGSGLGLAMSYTIARKHGGWIAVNTRPGEGSVFSTYLPREPAPPGARDDGEGSLHG